MFESRSGGDVTNASREGIVVFLGLVQWGVFTAIGSGGWEVPSACVSKAVLGRNLSGGVEQAYVLWVVVSNLYSHDSQWPIRDNSVRKEKE